MTCNCDNDGSNEYIIELGEFGLPGPKGDKGDPGYSPTVTYTGDGNGIQINIVNETDTIQTPVLPTKNYVDSSINNLDTTYLKKDGSNANNHIKFNNLNIVKYETDNTKLYSQGGGIVFTTGANSVTLARFQGSNINIGNELAGTGTLQLYSSTSNYSGDTVLKPYSTKNLVLNISNPQNKAYYTKGYETAYTNDNELATIGDIPTVGNGTITLTQGGVTKGTFTTNQSSNTTIDLDGGAVTNPLEIVSSNGNQSIFLGFEGNTNKVLFSEQLRMGGLSPVDIPLHIISSVSSPLSITKNDTSGLSTISINIDSNTLEVNQDGELTVIGGGGSSYTDGTGIDITNNVISVEDIQEFNTVTLANTIGNSGEGLYGTMADGSSTLPLVRIDTLDNALFGNNTSELYLFGDNTRPYYNNSTNTLALSSDIPDTTYMMTTNTSQTNITGSKTFHNAEVITDNNIVFTGSMGKLISRVDNGSTTTDYQMIQHTSIGTVIGNESENVRIIGDGNRPTYAYTDSSQQVVIESLAYMSDLSNIQINSINGGNA